MLLGCYHEEPHTPLLSLPHPGTHVGPLLPGSRQIQLAVPGAYEKPQLLPLEPSVEAGLPATFTFHVNPVLSSRLDVELGEQLTVLQSGLNAELESQISTLGEGSILLSSLALDQEERRFVVLGEVRLSLGS